MGEIMENLTLTAALAKALGGGGEVDPAVIEEAVNDWLDDHPEATTTVQDGSITKAKLDSNLQGTVDDVDRLNHEVATVATSEDTINLINPADIKSGYYCDNTSLNLTQSSSYNVVTVPVVAGETYTFKVGQNASIAIKRKFRYIVFADETMTGFGTVLNGQTSGVTDHGEFTAPEGAAYAIVSYSTDYNNIAMVIHGDIPPGFMPFYEYGKTYKADIDYTEISNLYHARKNLLNPDESVAGLLDGNGSIATSSQYYTSNFIPVEAGKTYCLSPTASGARTHAFYGVLKNLLSYSQVDKTYLFTPSVDGYVRFSYYKNVADRSMFEVGSTASGFDPYCKALNDNLHLNIPQLAEANAGNILYGKKWAVCGDSFTDGATNTKIQAGRYTGENYVYPYLIGNRNNMDIVKFFNGGETLAFPAEPGEFTNSLTCPSGTRYYQNIPADVDYITIYLGINDQNHASGSSEYGEDTTGVIPLGEITDDTTATYYGAWNVVLTWLTTNRPNAHIGIIVTNGITSTTNYRDAQIAIAKKYGIPYIDMNGDERTPTMLRTCNPDIPSAIKTALITKWAVDPSSNTHPNDNAQLYESTFIEAFLRSI